MLNLTYQRGGSGFGLSGAMAIDAATVLTARVVALSIRLGRVLETAPERVKQLFVRHLSLVVRDLHNFSVAGSPSTHVFVRRVQRFAVAVSNLGLNHAWDSLKHELWAPEAACMEWFTPVILC